MIKDLKIFFKLEKKKKKKSSTAHTHFVHTWLDGKKAQKICVNKTINVHEKSLPEKCMIQSMNQARYNYFIFYFIYIEIFFNSIKSKNISSDDIIHS